MFLPAMRLCWYSGAVILLFAMFTAGSTSTSTKTTSTKTTSTKTSSTQSTLTKTTSTTTTIGTWPTLTETALQATGTRGLADYARAKGKYMGTASNIFGANKEFGDNKYMAVLNNSHEFGALTSTDRMKFMYTEQSRGVFNFTDADNFVAVARASGALLRCHNLIWWMELPTWLTSTTWDNATLISIMENHIIQVISHFGDKCYCWDVVNEAFGEGAWWMGSIWYDTIGPAYLELAFRAAQSAVQAANLTTKLYYNDYNLNTNNDKSALVRQTVTDFKSRGIQIDGIGLEAHFAIGETPAQEAQASNMASFTALGVEVAITELDIRATSLPVSAGNQTQQYIDYRNTVAACAQTKGCVGVTIWDFDDTYSWIPGVYPGQGWACPWFLPQKGTILVKKLAYDGIVDGWTNLTAL